MAFKEYMVKRKRSGKDLIITALYFIVAAILGFIAYIFTVRFFPGIALLLVAAFFYGAYKLAEKQSKEFEYICTDDNIDIDVIFNRSSRKRLISFSLEQTEIIASVKDDRYNNRLKESFDIVIDATSTNPDANIYFIVVEKNGKTLVKFEPSQGILNHLSTQARSKVHIYE